MRNAMKTAVLLAFLGALFMGIGGAVGGQGGLLFGLVLGLLFCGGSYWFSDKLAIKAARAQQIDRSDDPELFSMVEDLAGRGDLPMPKVYVSAEQQPNAFATGRNPKHAAVCVTQGIRQVLSPDELRGVLAHELAHVKHRDILIGSVAAAVAMWITFAARMAMWGAMFGGGRGDDDDGGNAVAAIAMMVLAPIAAMLIQMAISRSREYEADAGGARLVGSGEPLARALEKIDAYAKRVPMNINPAQAQAFIINPLTGRTAQFANLFSTHPPTEERIRRLRAL
jgi:heat shock protein HtpX